LLCGEIAKGLDERGLLQHAWRSGGAGLRGGDDATGGRGRDSGARPRSGGNADRIAMGADLDHARGQAATVPDHSRTRVLRRSACAGIGRERRGKSATPSSA
jgi:hypothetical protein